MALSVGLGLAAAPANAEGPTSGAGTDQPGPMVLPVPLEQAGAYVGWDPRAGGGSTDTGQWDLPAELEGVALREVATAGTVTLALTADGRVVAWGQNGFWLQEIPAAVATMEVVDLVATQTNVGVVGADGRVLVWGASANYGDPTDVPQELTRPAAPGEARVVQLALGSLNAYGLKDDGTVVAWGNPGGEGFETYDGLIDVPDGLQATQISAGTVTVWALRTDGTVVGWGTHADEPAFAMPPALQSGNVRAIAASAGDSAAYALLADGAIVPWGLGAADINNPGLPLNPPNLGGKKAVAITLQSITKGLFAVDEDGMLRAPTNATAPLPPALTGESVAQVSTFNPDNAAAIVTRLLRAKLPTVTGTAQVGGGTLTGAPGTFSADPDEVTSQWLVNGQPVGTPVVGESAPGSLSLAGYPAGTTVAYRSTATKAGEQPVTSTSAAVTVAAAPAPGKVTPSVSLKVTKAPTMKKAGQATVTVQGGPVAGGTVTVTATGKVLKKGKKRTKTFAVTGAVANGTTTVKIKKIKGAKGKWTVTAAYAGDATHHPATSAPVKVKVKKK